MAAKFLKNKGYDVMAQNWRYGKKEIDIVAARKGYIIFAEVKTRSNFDFGFPEESVTLRKQSFLKTAAEAYCEAHSLKCFIRFDIISVCIGRNNIIEIHHIEDAFF